MKTKQEIQLELLQEIDDICSKNGLKYILFGKNALNAYLNHTIKDGPRMVAVAMTQGDIERFCKIIEEGDYKDRYVEGMFNNPNYIPFYVSYGNKNTADFHMVRVNRNKHHGMRIRIYSIGKLTVENDEIVSGWTKGLSRERKFRRFVNKRVDNPKFKYIKTGLNVLNGAYSLKDGGNHYYKKVRGIRYIDKWEDIQNYPFVRISKKQIAAEYLKDIEKIDVDGVKLCLPKDADGYFTELYDEFFREIQIKARKQRMRVVEDTEVSYKDITDETHDILQEIRNTHEEIAWTRRKAKKEKEAVANVWRLVKMTQKQFELRECFDRHIDELESYDLEDEEQFIEIYERLRPTIRQLRNYSKYDMTFSINPRADALIERVLLKNDEKEFVDKLKKLSKKEYFVE